MTKNCRISMENCKSFWFWRGPQGWWSGSSAAVGSRTKFSEYFGEKLVWEKLLDRKKFIWEKVGFGKSWFGKE